MGKASWIVLFAEGTQEVVLVNSWPQNGVCQYAQYLM
jgi:hypothetical protein